MRNASGYSDPTASIALGRIIREDKKKKRKGSNDRKRSNDK